MLQTQPDTDTGSKVKMGFSVNFLKFEPSVSRFERLLKFALILTFEPVSVSGCLKHLKRIGDFSRQPFSVLGFRLLAKFMAMRKSRSKKHNLIRRKLEVTTHFQSRDLDHH